MEHYDFEWRGEHVDVYGYGHTEADLCGGSLTEIDGHAAMIRAELGLADAPSSVFRWLSPDTWDAVEPCSPNALACASFGEAMAQVIPQMHEITHTIIDKIGSDGCPRLISEGLAMVYDGPEYDEMTPYWDETTMTIWEAMGAGFEWSPDFYANAARFASFLKETYGLELIVQLCEALPIEPTTAAWDETVRDVLGTSLEQLLADYEEYPECSYQQMRAKLWGCGGSPDVILTHEGERYILEAGCEDTKATNGVDDFTGDAVLLRRIHVNREMIVEVTSWTVGDKVGPDARYLIQECRPCSENPGVFVDAGHPVIESRHTLRPGRYEVSVFFDRRDMINLSLSVVAVNAD
jgi:hypothetical protein